MTVCVPLALSLLFTATGLGKLTRRADFEARREHLRVPDERWQQIGVIEIFGVSGVLLGLVWQPIGIAAAAGLALLSLGAIATHLRNGDGFERVIPAFLALALASGTVAVMA